MMRETTKPISQQKWPVVTAWVIIGIVTVGFLIAIFFTPVNNAMRSATGADTPADAVVKSQLIKRVEASKTGNAATDAKINQAVSKLKTTKMSTIMSAADNQQKMSQLLNADTGLSQKQSEAATSVIFNNTQYKQLRKAVAGGHWVQAYQAYQQLSDNGAISNLKNSVSE
ncbi:hypothetical protein FD04_GL001212 [Secundilactobacillus odoratitofui DSM 19909 = JCM 15043]|uniref:Uncharacterized protein n=2 Tax=Secundilactobacillus odoratitofui TaxID=480930 RepID=A0A0R1LRZ4_9LACO|nr:hypothetical protein FD04_GL001212 [Secundilactobacillus odoratitofui DSM 19909 = JCM 15043]